MVLPDLVPYGDLVGKIVFTPYQLLPVYVQQAPDPAWTSLPYRSQPDVEISEGPHLGYALQWFTFSALLGLGYPVFIRRQERKITS